MEKIDLKHIRQVLGEIEPDKWSYVESYDGDPEWGYTDLIFAHVGNEQLNEGDGFTHSQLEFIGNSPNWMSALLDIAEPIQSLHLGFILSCVELFMDQFSKDLAGNDMTKLNIQALRQLQSAMNKVDK